MLIFNKVTNYFYSFVKAIILDSVVVSIPSVTLEPRFDSQNATNFSQFSKCLFYESSFFSRKLNFSLDDW